MKSQWISLFPCLYTYASRRFSYFYRCWQTALQKGCTESHSLQQLRKGQFPHTVTSTRGLILFLFQKRQLRVLILRSPVPLGLGGRTGLIIVSFLLSPNSPAENRQQTSAASGMLLKSTPSTPRALPVTTSCALPLCLGQAVFSIQSTT